MATTIVVRFKVTRNRMMMLLSAVLLSFMATESGSETMQMSTFYPAPYGAYTKLLATGSTILARDTGSVAIGTTDLSAKLVIGPGLNESATKGGTIKFLPGNETPPTGKPLCINAFNFVGTCRGVVQATGDCNCI
ncbi:MAG: hypothetical protein ABIG11_01685 [bacterium]